jgi:Tol biopolymer transport system component
MGARRFVSLVLACSCGVAWWSASALAAPVLPVLSEEAVSDVSSTSVLFSAQVNPGGADTTFMFEYGTSGSYGQSVPVPAGDVGSGTVNVTASVRAVGLSAETAYHVRVVASNALGTVYGPDRVFRTQSGGGAFVLPDGRQWELVSPANKNGSLLAPIGGAPAGFLGLIQASVDGGAITYYASGPVGSNVRGYTNPAGVTQVLSRRGAGGWSSEDITTPRLAAGEAGGNGEYKFFSSDLSHAIVERSGEELLSPEATEPTPYVRDNSNGSFVALVSAANVPPGTKLSDGPEGSLGLAGQVRVPDVTPDLSHVILESHHALTANAIEADRSANSGDMNLYEWVGGRLQLINELPDHTITPAGAALGDENKHDTRNAVSSDGSRVVFTLTENLSGGLPGSLYVRDTVAGRTVRVDAPAPGVSQPPGNQAQFVMASADGSEVFFTDGEPLTLDSKLTPHRRNETGYPDLYVYDVATGSLSDLTVDQNAGEFAQVRGVAGASADGSVVYFIAEGKLAEGAETGHENLYVESKSGSSWSAPRLVGVLSENDRWDWVNEEWPTERVSADGRYLAFMSAARLKTVSFPEGYDNRDAASGQPDEEVFLYDRTSGRLDCVSCNPTGARPNGVFDVGGLTFVEQLLVDQGTTQSIPKWRGSWLAGNIPGPTPVENGVGFMQSYLSRVLSDDGRLFFNSSDALMPQDTNGREDVYEFEPQGVGGCARAGGCVSLISSGTSPEESAFLDASQSGNDVFFLTQARLVPADVDSSFDVYDAHVCSAASPCVSAPVSPPACTSGDSCKAAPSPQPEIFGAAPSATFSGTGNVTVTAAPSVKQKSLGRGQKLARALRACRKKGNRRVLCERKARKRYWTRQARRANTTRKG